MLVLLLAAAPAPSASVPDTVTLIVSIAAIALAISAIVFEAVFFAIQRNEARNITKCVQDLVSQAVRSEKGIDQLSDQMMPLVDRLVNVQLSLAREKVGPEVTETVSEFLHPVEENIRELRVRVESIAQSGGLKQEMEEKLEEMRKQISGVARLAGDSASSPVAFRLRDRTSQPVGRRAREVLTLLDQADQAGGSLTFPQIRQIAAVESLSFGAAIGFGEDQCVLRRTPEGIELTETGRASVRRLRSMLTRQEQSSVGKVTAAEFSPGEGLIGLSMD